MFVVKKSIKLAKFGANLYQIWMTLEDDLKKYVLETQMIIDFFELHQAALPELLFRLGRERGRITLRYLDKIKTTFEVAKQGSREKQARILARASGEAGTSYFVKIEAMLAKLRKAHSLALQHVTFVNSSKIDPSKQLSTGFFSKAMQDFVKGQRDVDFLQDPVTGEKVVRVGDTIKIKYIALGDITHLRLRIQVTHMGQKKSLNREFVTIEDKLLFNTDGCGEYDWTIPSDFLTGGRKTHDAYFFRLEGLVEYADEEEARKKLEAKQKKEKGKMAQAFAPAANLFGSLTGSASGEGVDASAAIQLAQEGQELREALDDLLCHIDSTKFTIRPRTDLEFTLNSLTLVDKLQFPAPKTTASTSATNLLESKGGKFGKGLLGKGRALAAKAQSQTDVKKDEGPPQCQVLVDVMKPGMTQSSPPTMVTSLGTTTVVPIIETVATFGPQPVFSVENMPIDVSTAWVRFRMRSKGQDLAEGSLPLANVPEQTEVPLTSNLGNSMKVMITRTI